MEEGELGKRETAESQEQDESSVSHDEEPQNGTSPDK